jgi:hypothetical protein
MKEKLTAQNLQRFGILERSLTDLEKIHHSRAQTTLVPSHRGGDFQFANRPKSSHRSTLRNSLLKSTVRADEKAREVSAAVASQLTATGKAISTPRSSSPKIGSPKRSPTEGSEEDSAGEEEKSTDENMTYALYAIVEAR